MEWILFILIRFCFSDRIIILGAHYLEEIYLLAQNYQMIIIWPLIVTTHSILQDIVTIILIHHQIEIQEHI
uniref:Putative secreted protein n=1 Tax=Xenopsylla cheopis TaxID=163159 RepID=A0A6M2E0Z0_XENCH